MREVVPGVYAIPGLKMGRSYLVEGDGGALALVDTSTGSASAGIVRAIEALGRRIEDLRLIVATHYHRDHTGNVRTLVERSGAQLCVHAADAPYVDGRLPWMPIKGVFGALAGRFGPKQYTLAVDRELRDGDVLPFAGGLRVVHAPGHTPGHIALHAPARGTLFTGDAMMNTLGLHPPLRMSSHDMDQAKRTISLLAQLDFEVALPGHGNPVLGRASEKIGEWSRRWL